jgi:arsenical pump membrane protein
LSRARSSQTVLFLNLYLVVSVLTVFTSNDIIVLTFTPFICYFAKNAKIDPLPYLICEFIAANTWSMALIIGNPTNIYLATGAGLDFLTYTTVMLLPTLLAGVASLLVLLLLFRKSFQKPMDCTPEPVRIEDKASLLWGLLCLGGCIVMLVLSSFLQFEMWLISLCFFVLLYVGVTVLSVREKKKPTVLLRCLKRAPWAIIPFVLSMFVMVLALESHGVTAWVSEALPGGDFAVWSYGTASFLTANLVNNIPMSVLFESIVSGIAEGHRLAALYAAIVGSNLGALFTPIGALAGIMWTGLIKAYDVKLSFGRFVYYGCLIAVPALLAALLGLQLVL